MSTINCVTVAVLAVSRPMAADSQRDQRRAESQQRISFRWEASE